LQHIISGVEVVGWKSLFCCGDIYKEYDAKKDIMFFDDKSDLQITLREGCFAFFFGF
jgi:beta-galactosidase beta subunit